jgi:hypothetical protein
MLIRRTILALSLLTGIGGCAPTIGEADVWYLHSPNHPPPPGTLFIATTDMLAASDAYAWLRLLGYEQAASAERADYLATLQTAVVIGGCTQLPHGKRCVRGDISDYALVRFTMRPAGGAQSGPPLVEIEAEGAGHEGYPDASEEEYLEASIPLVIELAFADFPGVAGARRTLSLKQRGNLVCVRTTMVDRAPHCRESLAPPGVLAVAPGR